MQGCPIQLEPGTGRRLTPPTPSVLAGIEYLPDSVFERHVGSGVCGGATVLKELDVS